jgi:hypothetical protein
MDVLLAGLGFLLGVLVPHWLVRWDEGRLNPEMSARAWNSASHWVAVFGFSFLCIPVHFTRTRRSFLGFCLGIGWMLLALFAMSLALELAALLLRILDRRVVF